MQQTSFDSWLRRKYVHVAQVYCNTLPRTLPQAVTVEETTEESGTRYLYRLTPANDDVLNDLTAHLEVENITYTSRIKDEEGIKDKLFNDPSKSFTMQVAWLIFIIAILAIIFSGLPVHLWKTLSADEEETEEMKKKAQLIKVEPTARFV